MTTKRALRRSGKDTIGITVAKSSNTRASRKAATAKRMAAEEHKAKAATAAPKAPKATKKAAKKATK